MITIFLFSSINVIETDSNYAKFAYSPSH